MATTGEHGWPVTGMAERGDVLGELERLLEAASRGRGGRIAVVVTTAWCGGLVAKKSSREGGWRFLKSSLQRDRVGQRADAFDGDRDALPGVQWADAGRGAGEDHVTGQQGHHPRHPFDQRGHRV